MQTREVGLKCASGSLRCLPAGKRVSLVLCRPVKGKGSRSKAMSEEAAAHLAAGSLLYAEGK